MPPVWMMLGVGDRCYYLGFQFLEFVAEHRGLAGQDVLERGIGQNEAEELGLEFAGKIDFGKHPCIAEPMCTFLVSLLKPTLT